MINIEQIKKFYPNYLQNNPVFKKYMLKEYIQLLILDYLSRSQNISKLSFIGGTNLRLIKGIDRFSEDLDFDCTNFSLPEFNQMGNKVLRFLELNGFRVETKKNQNTKLKAFRYNIYFPEFLI